MSSLPITEPAPYPKGLRGYAAPPPLQASF
jgi:hypothetical protein